MNSAANWIICICILVGVVLAATLVGATRSPKPSCRDGFVLLTRATEGVVCVEGYKP